MKLKELIGGLFGYIENPTILDGIILVEDNGTSINVGDVTMARELEFFTKSEKVVHTETKVEMTNLSVMYVRYYVPKLTMTVEIPLNLPPNFLPAHQIMPSLSDSK